MRQQKAFALPLVLVILATLTVMSITLSRMAKGIVGLAHQQQQEWRDELLINDAFQQLLVLLMTANKTPGTIETSRVSIPADGRWVPFAGLQISVQDANGLFLVQPSIAMWQSLLQAYMPERDATLVTARIVDWLDADGIASSGGMERAEYLAVGLSVMPRNGKLRTLDELLNIPGITPQLFNKGKDGVPALRDILFLNNTRMGFNPATAPILVLKAKMRMGDNEVRDVIRYREQKNWDQLAMILGSDRLGEEIQLQMGLEFAILMRTESGRQARIGVRVTASHLKPYEILYWYYPDYERL
jgi:type II secretory pathway component PulK